MNKLKALLATLGLMFLNGPRSAFAQEVDPDALSIERPKGFGGFPNIPDLVSSIASLALILAALLAFLYLIWGGISWITSGGDKAKTEEARNRITAALVGLVLVAASWAIIALVQEFIGINIFDAEKSGFIRN